MNPERTQHIYGVVTLAAFLFLSAAPAPKNPRQVDSPKPNSNELKLARVKAAWGPAKGPDGKPTSANTAVIPKEIMDVILTDVNAWYALEIEGEPRKVLLEAVRKHFEGQGPTAGFRRVKTKQGKIELKDPQVIKTWHFMGDQDQPFEFGCWPPGGDTKTTPREDGYEWTLTWMMQLRWEQNVRRYRVDVNLIGTLDPPTGGIKYQAVWAGPYKEDPVDLKQLRSELKHELE